MAEKELQVSKHPGKIGKERNKEINN